MKPIRFTCITIIALLATLRGWATTPGHERDLPTRRDPAAPQRTVDDDLAGTWDGRFDPPGPNGTVLAVAMVGGDLYVGGDFTMIGNVAASHIARWDGHAWHALGEGMNNGVSRTVRALLVDGDSLFVGGQFDRAGDIAVNNIAVWHPATGGWSTLGQGVSGQGDALVTAMIKSGTDLYVAGRFDAATNVLANSIARWDGSRWARLGAGIQGLISTLAISGSQLYVGGVFQSAGGSPAQNLAAWDMTLNTWGTVGGGVDSIVCAIAVHGNDVYVGGHFDMAGGVPVANMAVWNEASRSWRAFPVKISRPPFMDGYDPAYVYALLFDGSTLYIGGSLTFGVASRYAFTDSVTALITWNVDTQRMSHPVSGLLEFNLSFPRVNALLLAGGVLYVGGSFPLAGYYEGTNVAEWRLAEDRWVSLGTSVDGASGGLIIGDARQAREAFGLRTVLADGDDIYAGGYFASAGGAASRNVARWDGGSWHALADGVGDGISGVNEYTNPEHVAAMAKAGSSLYVGGLFTTAGGVPAANIARWDGQRWYTVGSTSAPSFAEVYAMTVIDGSLYVAGSFVSTGLATTVARLDGESWTTLGASFDGPVHTLAGFGGALYVGGSFSKMNDAPVGGLVRCDLATRQWSDAGVGGPVWALLADGGKLYAGGEFSTAGGMPASRIAAWDGAGWAPLGDGIGNGIVRAIARTEDHLYAGGDFSPVQGAIANYLAAWDGESWRQVGGGLDYRVTGLAPIGKELYVCGDFEIAGTVGAHYFTRWTPEGVASAPLLVDAVTGAARTAIVAITPNPAADASTIAFRLPHAGHVTLGLFDALGRQVAWIAEGEFAAGPSIVGLRAEGLPSGTYFCRLAASGEVATARLVISR